MIIGIDGNEANIQNRVGVNQYAAQLLSALESLPESKNHEFAIYLKDFPLTHLPKERQGWRYKVLPARGMWVFTRLLPYLYSKEKPDVFFTPSHYTPLIVPVPTVLSIMDLGYLNSKEQFEKYDYYQLKYWGVLSMRFAKTVIAISESTKRDIIENYSWAKDKVLVVYPACDSRIYRSPFPKKEIERVTKKYEINDEYLLFLSTLKPSKNIEGLLDAFKNVGQKYPELKLVIAGKKGWLFASIFEKVKSLDLESRVVFTDYIPEEDKPGLMAGAKVFVSPSFWEGFGMHVLEAMALGVPVVVSDVGSLPEVVGGAGILVDPKDSKNITEGIVKALEKHDLLRNKVIDQAKKFNWNKTAKTTLKALKKR